jgi:antitoxin component YwqK of YwqJK toxin-antitoxin module
MLNLAVLLFLLVSCTAQKPLFVNETELLIERKVSPVVEGRSGSTWYQSGSPKTKEVYEGDLLLSGEYFTKENRLESAVKNKTGLRTRRNEFGDLLSLDTIENGKMVSRTIPYSNGSPKEVIPYVDGVIEGEKKTFSENGEPLTREAWKQGVQEGVTIVFQNGEKYAEVPYVKGLKEGIEKRYRKGKTLIEEIAWVGDKRQGASYTYMGESVKTDWYFEGRQVTKKQYDLMLKKQNGFNESRI